MNKKLGLAVASAVLAFSASAANAGIVIPAGDWTVDIGGNVNAFYSNVSSSTNKPAGHTSVPTTNTTGTGLLPSAFGVGAKTRQNDLDIGFQFSFFTGTTTGTGHALASNTLNIRQAYLTFGDKSWGTIKAGRDLGLFGSDAILSDMTLLGVGAGTPGGSSTLGRIGTGYIYADWYGQFQYTSPNWNGFSFAVAAQEPIDNSKTLAGGLSDRGDMGYTGKINYDWTGDVSGKAWLGAISQKHSTGTNGGYTSEGVDLGAKIAVAGFGLVGYYYDGRGLDSQNSGVAGGLLFASGEKTNDRGGYVQATYTIPGIGTKLGASWGESKSQSEISGSFDYKNESWILGAYHPLTKSLNLVAEYANQKITESVAQSETRNNTVTLGAIMFF